MQFVVQLILNAKSEMLIFFFLGKFHIAADLS